MPMWQHSDRRIPTSRFTNLTVTLAIMHPYRADSERRFRGYSPNLVNMFVCMGFEIDAVVDAFEFVGIERNGGRDYTLEEAYMGDITARLLGEH